MKIAISELAFVDLIAPIKDELAHTFNYIVLEFASVCITVVKVHFTVAVAHASLKFAFVIDLILYL